MTSQIVFSQRNEVNDDTKTSSRDVSVKSAVKDLNKSIEEFNRDTNNLVTTLANINVLLKKCSNQIVTIEWAAKELIAFYGELYALPKVTKTTSTTSNGGKTTTVHITYPNIPVWTEITNKYLHSLGEK